jgi:nitrogen regulatory protein P-II 2
MKMIAAVIKPFKLDEVYQSLLAIGIEGMTVTEVSGYGRQKGATETYRGAEYAVNFLPRLKVEIAVSDDMEKKVIKAIQDAATTGRIGDGKIFVYDLTNVVRIRTGESGTDAIA